MTSTRANPCLHSEFGARTPVQAARHIGLSHVEARLVELGVPALAPAEVERWRSGEVEK